jgi:hypothetical protein
MAQILSFVGKTRPIVYALAAPALVLSQHLVVMLAFHATGWKLVRDTDFWFFPLRRLALMPYLPAWAAALAFTLSLVAAWGLALLSFRRARWSGVGYIAAALAIVPGVQIAAIALLALLPRFADGETTDPVAGVDVAHVVQGVLAGVAIIVLAVLVSALTFGAYGWGLFVMTPFLVGITTGYLANRRSLLGNRRTALVVLAAAALGTVALVMFALEGVICIVLAAPLGAVVAMIGGSIGRSIAGYGRSRDKPLMSIALLPALFALEAAMPPAVPIQSYATIDIQASPPAVWQALTSDAAIASGPGLIGATGLAYPIRGWLPGEGVGAVRLGEFSTGVARERVTEWVQNRRLAFVVVRQPPAMEEMSPYRRVHAPHVNGYFDTGVTRFSLNPIVGGGTRLTVATTHILRIDPALYWEPIARLAIRLNVSRVLQDIRSRAEQRPSIG